MKAQPTEPDQTAPVPRRPFGEGAGGAGLVTILTRRVKTSVRRRSTRIRKTVRCGGGEAPAPAYRAKRRPVDLRKGSQVEMNNLAPCADKASNENAVYQVSGGRVAMSGGSTTSATLRNVELCARFTLLRVGFDSPFVHRSTTKISSVGRAIDWLEIFKTRSATLADPLD
jgi:hypothetical protein